MFSPVHGDVAEIDPQVLVPGQPLGQRARVAASSSREYSLRVTFTHLL